MIWLNSVKRQQRSLREGGAVLQRYESQMRHRVLRACVRHGLLAQRDGDQMRGWAHGGGFSLDASVRIEGADRVGRERLLRYCARPPFALEHLHQHDAAHLLYAIAKPRPDRPRALVLTPLELIDQIAALVPPPRIQRHRYYRVLAPNAPLRAAVTASPVFGSAASKVGDRSPGCGLRVGSYGTRRCHCAVATAQLTQLLRPWILGVVRLNYLSFTSGYKRDVQQERLRTTFPIAILDRPIIATGRGGSGTRLIGTILQNLEVFMGTRINYSMDSMQWVELIHEMAAKLPSIRPTVQTAYWRDVLREQAAWILKFGHRNGQSPWGWKLPETMLILPEVYAAFPDARLIHVIRHPLDSCLRRDHLTSRPDNPVGHAVLHAAYELIGEDPSRMWSDEAFLRNAVSYNLQVGSAARFCRTSLSPDRFLELRYEDICSTPAQTTRSVADFLGISNPENTPDLSIDRNRMRAWSIDDSRISQVWEICRNVGDMLGYQLPHDLQ